MGPKTLEAAQELMRARGPRWFVMGSVRRNQEMTEYADTAERAEHIADHYRDMGYYQVKVHPPLGSVDLAKLGRARTDAKRVFDEATAVLRAAVLRALEEDRSEVEVAQSAGVDRMTVRKWAGKDQA